MLHDQKIENRRILNATFLQNVALPIFEVFVIILSVVRISWIKLPWNPWSEKSVSMRSHLLSIQNNSVTHICMVQHFTKLKVSFKCESSFEYSGDSYWRRTLDVSRTASMKSLLSVCLSVRPSLYFLKIGSLVFSDIYMMKAYHDI